MVSSLNLGRRPVALIVSGMALAAIGPVVVIIQPVVLVFAVAAVVGVLLLVNGHARLMFVVFGGLTALYSSQELNFVKLAYLVGTGLALAGALYSAASARSGLYRFFRPVVVVSTVFFCLVGLSFAVAASERTSSTSWLRDAAPYFLFALAPIFALDASRNVSRRVITATLLLAAGLAGIAFAVQFLGRRQFVEIPAVPLGLPSVMLPAAIFAYSVSHVLQAEKHRLRWTAVAVSAVFLVALTGSRSVLVFMAALIAAVVFSKGRLLGRILRLGLFVGLALPLFIILFEVASASTPIELSKVGERFGSTVMIVGNLESDQSYRERLSESRAAWQVFLSNPLVGAGPGHLFEWQTASGITVASFNLDTALSYPAKFGLAGVIALATLIGCLVSFVRRRLGDSLSRVPPVAILSYGAIAAAWTPFGSPLEDKGFSLGLLLLLALSVPKVELPSSVQILNDRAAVRQDVLQGEARIG